jgi:hypothetical protein
VPAEHLCEQAVADLPDLQRVEGDRDRVAQLVGFERGGDVEAAAQERPHRVHEERDELVDRHVLDRARGQVAGDQRRHRPAYACGRPRPRERRGVEAERPLRGTTQLGDRPLRRVGGGVAGLEVAGVVGLERVTGEDRVEHGRRGGAVGGVEQLAERDRGRPPGAGVLVGAGEGDHEVLGRRHDRVEQQLAVLTAAVALPGLRTAGEHVVTVDDAGAREDAVIEAEQADHAVRHGAHRHHRADREGAGAEVGASGPAREAAAEEGAYVGQPELGAGFGISE